MRTRVEIERETTSTAIRQGLTWENGRLLEVLLDIRELLLAQSLRVRWPDQSTTLHYPLPGDSEPVSYDNLDPILPEDRAAVARFQEEVANPIRWNPYNQVVQDHRDGTIDFKATNRERVIRGLEPLEPFDEREGEQDG